MALLLASSLFHMTHWMTLVTPLHVLMTCRAGTTLSSSKAYKLCPSTPPELQKNEAEADQGSSGQTRTSVVARITVATAAYVPEVSDIDILCRLHHLICSVEGGCFRLLVAFVMLLAGVVGQVELQLSCARSLKLLLLLSCKCQLTSLQLLMAADFQVGRRDVCKPTACS